MSDEFDVVVVGAGQVGETVADRVARAGLTTAVVEAELAGGDCHFWACIPSKALLRAVDLAADVRRVPGMTLKPLDVEAVFARRDKRVRRAGPRK